MRLATALIVGVVAGSAFAADNAPPCLTKEQARARWPKAILYWHTANRCWDNIPVGRYRHQARQEGRTYIAQDANGNWRTSHKQAAATIKTVRPDEYNEIDAQADKDVFFRDTPVPLWPPVILLGRKFVPWDERIK